MLLKLLVYFQFTLFSFGRATDRALDGLICDDEFLYSYNYGQFHRVSDIASQKTFGFRLDFKVKAPSNAHVGFMSFPASQDPMYEIVFGANWNTYSDIRRGKATTSKVRAMHTGLVSPSVTRGFWIYAHYDGRILLGNEGDEMPFLMWKDPNPFTIRYISFSSWKNEWGRFYFNCRKKEEPKQENVITTPRPLNTRTMLMTDNLRKNLLEGYDRNIAPRPSNLTESTRTVINVHLACDHVTLDVKKSLLDIYGTMSMSWADEKLRWSPEDYGNKKSIVVQAWEIWVPDLLLYNAAKFPDWDALYGLKDVGAIVNHQGTVFWAPKTHLSAFCENINLKKWPKDTQTCELRLGFWSQQHLLQLELLGNVSYLKEEKVESEWEVTNASVEISWIRTPWMNSLTKHGMDIPFLEEESRFFTHPKATDKAGKPENAVHSSMALKLTLARHRTSYNTVLIIPLAMIFIFTLASMWATPFGQVKLGLQCLTLITATLFLLVTWNVLPAHADYVPAIVSAYESAMIMACMSVVATVAVINFTQYPSMENLPAVVTAGIKYKWISTILFLPSNVEQVQKKYWTLIGCQKWNENLVKKVDLTTKELEIWWNWLLLSTLIDRAMFFIYIILFFYTFLSF